MKKFFLVGTLLVFIILIVAIISLRLLSGDEDTWLCQNGQWVKHGNPRAAPPTIGCEPAAINNEPVVLDNLQANQTVSSPLVLTGKALGPWFFEASFPVKIVDANNNVLAQEPVQAIDDWMQLGYVRFKGVLDFTVTATTTGYVVFNKDNPSGLPANEAEFKVPVTILPTVIPKELIIKVYFGNTIKDPQVLDCQKVFAVERKIPYTVATAKTAINELLEGITPTEKNLGYFSSLPSGVKLQKITIENSVAKADFDDRLEYQVGGSCRVAAIASQIRQTLLQFPAITSVIISINGRTEDILQP